MKLKGCLHLIVALAAMVAPAAVAQDTHGVAPLDPPVTVKVAYVPIMKFATMYVAADRGLFAKYGLNVKIDRVKSGTEAIAFLEQGQIDVGGIAIVTSLWNGWHQGLDLKVFAPGALEPFHDSPTKFMVRKDLMDSGKVKTIADLKGMTVALAGGPGSGGEYLASKALERGDLTIRDVRIAQIGNADIPAAFANGSIDAALLGSPYADQVESDGTAVPIATDLTPGLMTVAFVGSGDFLRNRPEAAKRFALALMEAARMMQGDQYLSQANLDAYLSFVNSTPEALRKGTPVVYDPNQVIPVDGLADVERVHRENGRTDYTTPVDLSKVVDTSFTDWARGVLGKVQTAN